MRFEIDHDEPRIFLLGIRIRRRYDGRPTDYRFLVTRVVHEDLIARVHRPKVP